MTTGEKDVKRMYYDKAAKLYVENNMNGAETLRQLSPENKNLSEGSLHVKSNRLLRNDNFKVSLAKLLKGIDDEYINDKIKEGIEAKRVTEYKGKATLTDIPDYSERRKMLDIALQLKDAYPSKKTINLDIKADLKNRLREQNEAELKRIMQGNDA